VSGQTKPLSEQAAATAMTALWRDSYPSRWTYEHGLKGIERVWANTKKKEYLDFIQQSIDHFVADDGSIRTYSADNYNIDNILPGRNLMFLYKTTGNEKYRKAATLLREQLKTHPRTSEGGFWPKYQVMDKGGEKGNYLEASAACMFVPYRDGSYENYVNEKVVTNDPKGIGAFLLAATEMESV